MSLNRNRSSFFVLVVCLLALAVVAVSCGGDNSGSASPTTIAAPTATTAASSGATAAASASSAATSKQYPPVTLKLLGGTANSGIFSYENKTGILADALAKVNARVQWVDGPAAFSANLDAMKAGNVTGSQAAVSPIIGALIAGLDFKIFAVGPRSDLIGQAGIISPKGSSIKTVQDLVGKKVAVNPAAHGEYILLKALQNANIPFDKVTRVPIQPPDAAAAFASGAVDAWATFNTFYTTAVANGAQVIADEASLDSDDVTVLAASKAQLEQNPAAFKVVIDTYNQLAEEGRTNPEEFQNIFQQSGPTYVSGDQLKQAIAITQATPPLTVVGADGTAKVQSVLDIFVKAGVLQKSVPVDDVVFNVDKALAGA